MTDIDSLTEKLASYTVDEDQDQEKVNFVGKGLTLDTEQDAAIIVKAIQDCPGMTSLHLEGNTVGIPAAKAIATVLEKQPNFKKALWRDMFTRRDKTEIPQALSHLSNGIMVAKAQLTVLDLSDNAFGPRGLVGLQQLLESSSCYTLQELHLNNNGLGIQGAQLLSKSICNCIENSRKNGSPMKLRIFVCGRNRLENDGAILVSKFLKKLGTLESVAMPQNGIYHEGIMELADAFSVNPSLKVINIEDNSLTKDGARYIADCLPVLKELQMLNLGDCLVRTEGAMTLAHALEENCPELREVDLGFNEIGIEGGEAITDALEHKDKLVKVILNGNNFGDEGCEAIIKRFSEMGKEDQLGSFSEDEGEPDEDDDDHYDEGESEESNKSLDDKKEHDKSLHKSPMSKVSPADFISNPTADSLLALFDAKEDFSTLLPKDPTVADYIDLFFKISLPVNPDREDVKNAACKYTDDFLSKAYSLSSNVAEFNNYFFVGIGLIKGEDKTTKHGFDISGTLLVLGHAVKQTYFHASTRDLLQLFLSRPLQYVTASSKMKHLLMQLLFQV